MKVLRYSDTFKVPETYLRYMFSDDAQYDNVIFILGIQCMDVSDLKSRFPGYKLIAYQLEQLFKGSPWLNNKTIHALNQVDEIWDYDTLNIDFYRSYVNKPIKHFPMNKYCEPFDVITQSNDKDIDVLFFGALSERRMNALNYLTNNTKHKIIIAMNHFDESLNSLLDRTKVVLNIHFFDNNRQEQVRINPLVSSGIPVLSEASEINYFSNYIIEFKTSKQMVETIDYMIENDRYKNLQQHLDSFRR